MEPLPDLTIVLGPQTRASLALNAHLRENRHYLTTKGIAVFPNRVASPILRRALDNRPEAERLAQFEKDVTPRPAILSAVNLFGPPHAGLANGEMFPDAEVALAGLAPFIGTARVVLAIDPLPAFFLAAGSEALEARVRSTPWESLYELSWFELVSELVDLLPDASVVVLTGQGVGKNLPRLSEMLLGQKIGDLPFPHTMLRHLVSQTGHAVLDRLAGRDMVEPATLEELHTSFAVLPTREDLGERLGIDRVTNVLLEQRFEEDLERISGLAGVDVI